MPTSHNAQCPWGLLNACQRISSLEKKPASGGKPAIVAVCPVSPELAAQIVAMSELDWEDLGRTEAAMSEHGWTSTGDYLGDLGEKAYTPAPSAAYRSVWTPSVRAGLSLRSLDRALMVR